MPIPQDTIDQIRDRADIVEVVSRFVDLKRTGSNYKALCPFHEEKTPSFVVSPDKQIFHCFGCSKGGNVFTFLMEMEGVSFPEAVRTLAGQLGIEIPRDRQDDAQRSENEELYRVTDFAARWYHRNLKRHPSAEAARRYLQSRQVPESAWERFRLGFAGVEWDRFVQAARRQRVPLNLLLKLRLIVARDRTSGYYDYFRGRLMFPIALLSGRVVGFGARTLDASVEPKYLNSIESPIYQKRRILYGLPQSREPIREARKALIVEGYTDCIALHSGGFENVLATCGTAVTTEHGALLRRLCRSVVLIPDGDAAGREAALGAGAVLLAAGLEVQVVPLEDGSDPDSAIRAQGPGEFAKILGRALEYLPYVDYIMRDKPMPPRQKEGLIQRIVAGFGSSEDPLRHEVLLQDLARVLQIDVASLKRPRAGRRTTSRGEDRERSRSESARRIELEKILLRLLLESTPEVEEARERLVADDFSQETCRKFYKLLDLAWEAHIDIRSNSFQRKAEATGLEGFAAEIALLEIPPGNPGTLLKDTVKRMKELQIRDELDVLREKLRTLPEDSEEALAVAEHYARLKRALSEL